MLLCTDADEAHCGGVARYNPISALEWGADFELEFKNGPYDMYHMYPPPHTFVSTVAGKSALEWGLTLNYNGIVTF